MKEEESFTLNDEDKLNDINIPEEKKYINIIYFLKIIFLIINFVIICYNVPKELQDKKTMDITNNDKTGINIIDNNNKSNIPNNAINTTNNKSNIINNKPYKINKTIAVVFAGRKRYLELLIKYLMNLKNNNNKITEIHFWQFTNVKEDEEYLNSISNLHKTTGKFNYFRNIYPVIEKNSFNISIKQEKEGGGAVLLINDKYEITFKYINKLEIELSIKLGNNIFTTRQKNIYNQKEFSNYTICIINKEMIITGKDDFYIKSSFEDNNINSIKIHSTKNSLTVWDYEESINKGLKLFDSDYRSYDHWYEAYKFYLDYDFDILLKIDDDITFIDINRFDEFIDYIISFKKNVTIPNLVNHAVSLYYNNKYGLVPDNILNKKYLEKPSSLKVYDYYKDGKESVKMHEYFLDNVDKYINNNIQPINLNGQKPSICMFGITKDAYNKVYTPQAIWKRSNEPRDYIFQDEPYTYNLLNNYIYPRFVCAHYAFGPQRKSGLSESYLEKYEILSTKFLKE